jgi:hypothetical protein
MTMANRGVGSTPISAARFAWGRTSVLRKPSSWRFSLAPIPSATDM